MEIELKELSGIEFPDFVVQSIEEYAQGLSINHGLDIALARDRAKSETVGMLNKELNSKTNYLKGILDKSLGEIVGGMLYEINEEKKSAFGCQIIIFEQYRRKGYAKTAIKKLESELKEKGIKKFNFNVFGNNEGALKLYQILGYHVTNTHMAKDL